MFPHDREIPEQLIQELTGILLHAGIGTSEPGLDDVLLTGGPDCMTSPNSTTIYSEGELNKLLGYVRDIRSVGGNFGFSACIIGTSNILPPVNAPNQFSRPLDEFLQYVLICSWRSFEILRRPCSNFPLFQFLRSKGGSPHQRPDDIRCSAKANVLDQALVDFLLLCSRATSQRYVRSLRILFGC